MGANPWQITGNQVRIATPTLSWETRGYRVNEGPAVIIRNGRVFMTFSASATDANYCIGLLTASATANLLSASSWVKTQTPVFQSNSRTGEWGPGHNSSRSRKMGRVTSSSTTTAVSRTSRATP